jgi:signal transduction histidine kinase
MSLRTRLFFGLTLLLLVISAALTAALSLPQSNWNFVGDIEANQLLARQDGNASLAVEAFYLAGTKLAAQAILATEEPDVVPTYADFNQLMQQHSALATALKNDQLEIQLADGSRHQLQQRPRKLSDLSASFWLQLGCGASGLLICLLVLISQPNNNAIRAFAVTGLSYLLFTSAASIYSTRSLFIDGQWFHTLSMLNHTGAMLFSAALCSLLWNYPKVIGGKFVSITAYSLFVLNIIVDGLQLTEGPATGSYLWVFGVFLFGLVGSLVQWWFARKNPLARGAVRWLLVSIYAGTFFFAGGMMLPVILQIPPVASQALLFTTFLLMYAGLALGVIRYRLFDLERWWFSIWAWVLGGIAIVLVDIVLASLLTLSSTSSLILATATVGWIYFPVRQWCWRYISYRRGTQIESWLPQAVSRLIDVKSSLQLELAWEDAIKELFQPLFTQHQYRPCSQASIEDNGLNLVLPTLYETNCLVLQHANQGQRLFTREDRNNANTLLSLYRVMQQSLDARLQGAHAERDRIRQDIHDDLGAKLLSILRKSPQQEQQDLVREALNDLRDLLRSIEINPIEINLAIAQWEQETRQRLQNSNCKLHWQSIDSTENIELSPEQYSNLTRVLRESITNSLRHAEPQTISVVFSIQSNALHISVENDGCQVTTEKSSEGGRGLSIMQTRIAKLQGSYQAEESDNSWRLQLRVPLDS